MSLEKLRDEFEELKTEINARFDSFSFLEEENFKTILREVVRSEERERLLNKIYLAIVVFGVIAILLVGFTIFILLFTVPA